MSSSAPPPDKVPSPPPSEWRGASLLRFDITSLLYVFTLLLLSIVIIAVMIKRQITRLRLNSARREPFVNMKDLPKRARVDIKRKLEAVKTLRLANLPKLTDCKLINEHYNAPYLNRMIGIEEVGHEIDAQMERLSPSLKRAPGESTLAYLTRLRVHFPTIPLSLVHRIAFLYECARHRMQKFDMEQRMELKSLLNQFVKIVGESAPLPDGADSRTSSDGRRRRSKFGGSDGVRLLMSTSGREGAAAAAAVAATTGQPPQPRPGFADDRRRLLPSVSSSPFMLHSRRRSDTNFKGPEMAEIAKNSAAAGGLVTSVVDLGGGLQGSKEALPTTTVSSAIAPARPTVAPIPQQKAATVTTPELVKTTALNSTGPEPWVNSVLSNIGDQFRISLDNFKDALHKALQTGGALRPCRHNGTRAETGKCVCRPHFSGDDCERKLCLNGGELVTLLGKPECKCLHPPYISGPHCEVVSCANGGHVLAHNESACACVSPWHAGRFCEASLLHQYAPIVGIVTLVLLFLLCCCVCRLDLCPRRKRHSPGGSSGSRRQSRPPARNRRGPTTQQRRPDSLLAEERARATTRGARDAVPPPPADLPYVIRLDTLPVFNPDMIGGVPITGEDGKVLDPPPPYDQALSAPLSVQPPRYSPPETTSTAAGASVNGGVQNDRRSAVPTPAMRANHPRAPS